MCEPLKYDLLQKEKAFKKIEDKMYSIRSEYVESRGSGNTLYVLDKVIVKYVELVSGKELPKDKDDFCTLMNWQNKTRTNLAELRSEILSADEMRQIVLNGLNLYEKSYGDNRHKVAFSIHELTVVDMWVVK